MTTIAECLPNVIVPKKIVDVVWGWHTIVDAQMNCLNDIFELRNRFPWQYAVTLCGKEVPLRTNREMVNTLQKLNETSVVELEDHHDFEYSYWKFEHHLVNKVVTQSNVKLGPIKEHGILWTLENICGISTAKQEGQNIPQVYGPHTNT